MLRATALALLALVGCSDGGTPTGPGPEPAPSGRFTADRSTYVPFRVAQLALDAPAPQPGASITGTLGGVGVDLLAAEDSVLLVAIPDLAAGNHVLTFAVGSREYRGSLTITSAPALPDPVAYLDAVTEHATATIAAIRAGIDSTAGGGAREAMLELLSVAEDSLAAFDNARATLSPADAAIVAQVLRANYAGLEGFPTAAANTTFSTMPSSAALPECANLHPLFEYECTWNEFVDAATFSSGFAALSVLAAKGIAWTGPIGFVVSAGSATVSMLIGARALDIGLEVVLWKGVMAYKAGTEVVAATSELFRTTFPDEENSFPSTERREFPTNGLHASPTDDQHLHVLRDASTPSPAAANMTRLSNGVTMTFSFSPRVRNVQAADAALPVTWLTQGLRLIESYNAFIGRFTTRAQITLPAATMAWLEPVPFEQIDIEVVANDRVRLDSLFGADDRISMRFATDEETEQAFTYDVVYSSGVYPTVRVRYDAVLEPPSYQLTWLNRAPVPDAMSLYGGVYYPLMLLDEAGVPVARDWSTDGITLENSTNPNVTPVWYHNGTRFDVSFEVSGGQTQVNTEVDVVLDGRVITRLALELTDSLAFYRNVVTGGWTRESYYQGEGVAVSEQWTLHADGTMTTPRPNEGTWDVWVEFDPELQLITNESRPYYGLAARADRLYDIRLSQPLVPHEEDVWIIIPTTWYRVVITKN